MRPESKTYLFDIRAAGRLILEFTRDRKFEDYKDDALVRSATERQFEIIVEALRKLAREDEFTAARIEGASRIVAFRNREVLTTKLPSLLRQVELLLEEP